jgi:hypothetical protein
MVNEPDTTTYSDVTVQTYIETYPLVDMLGQPPYVRSTTTPYAMIANIYWTATYDLNAAAADILTEKAAVLGQDFDFSADGGSYTRSQAYQQMMSLARHYRARRSPKTITLRPEPIDTVQLGSEDDD